MVVLERRVQSQADTESEVKALSALSSQQSEALRNLATSLERISLAMTKAEHTQRHDTDNIWAELRRLQSSKELERALPSASLEKTVTEFEYRFSRLEQQAAAKATQDGHRSAPSSEKVQLLEAEVAQLRLEVAGKVRGTQEVEAALARKAGWADVEVLVSGKADTHTVAAGLRGKADACELEKLAAAVASALTRDEARHLFRNEVAPLIAAVSQCELQGRRRHAGEVFETADGEPQRGYGRRRNEAPKESRRAADEAWVRQLASQEAARALEVRARRDDLAAAAHAERIEAALRSDLAAARVQTEEGRTADREAAAVATRGMEERLDAEAAAAARASAEVVRVLNLKAYKSDATKALKEKAGCEALEGLKAEVRKKADAQEVRMALNRTADMLQALLGDLKAMQGQGAQGALHAEEERAKLALALKELKGQLQSEAARASLAIEDRAAAKLEELVEGQKTAVARLEASAAKALLRLPPELPPSACRGRWLWRSGNLRDGWCPWEAQAANTAPQVLAWRPEQPTIVTCTVPGLYHLVVGFFTHASASIVVCVNGEPVLTRAPGGGGSSVEHLDSTSGDCVVRRSRHSAGDVTSIALDEFLALPAPAALSVRFSAIGRAQGFLALEKL
jgi:hypothetical protein